MKPIKLSKADDVSYLEVGLILRDVHLADEASGQKKTYEVTLNSDIFKVEITYQETQTKIDIKKIKTIDDIIAEAERR